MTLSSSVITVGKHTYQELFLQENANVCYKPWMWQCFNSATWMDNNWTHIIKMILDIKNAMRCGGLQMLK